MVNFILDAFKLLSFLISQKSTAGESAFCLVIAWEEKKNHFGSQELHSLEKLNTFGLIASLLQPLA